MDKQLLWIIKELEKLNIYYWCDGGTLLGLVRDGKLIEGDNDIDIGILSKDIGKMDKLVSKLKNNGQAYTYSNKGNIFKYKFDLKELGNRKIDINVFRKKNDYMWCPQAISSEGLRSRRISYRLINYVTFRIYQLGFLKNKEFSKFPWNYTYKFAYWCVSKKYFNNIQTLKVESYTVKIPFNVKEYLYGRYGNWKVANPDWNFQQDDGMLINELPKK